MSLESEMNYVVEPWISYVRKLFFAIYSSTDYRLNPIRRRSSYLCPFESLPCFWKSVMTKPYLSYSIIVYTCLFIWAFICCLNNDKLYKLFVTKFHASQLVQNSSIFSPFTAYHLSLCVISGFIFTNSHYQVIAKYSIFHGLTLMTPVHWEFHIMGIIHKYYKGFNVWWEWSRVYFMPLYYLFILHPDLPTITSREKDGPKVNFTLHRCLYSDVILCHWFGNILFAAVWRESSLEAECFKWRHLRQHFIDAHFMNESFRWLLHFVDGGKNRNDLTESEVKQKLILKRDWVSKNEIRY